MTNVILNTESTTVEIPSFLLDTLKTPSGYVEVKQTFLAMFSTYVESEDYKGTEDNLAPMIFQSLNKALDDIFLAGQSEPNIQNT